ncbi:Mov34/MPN/PAD-1 family protein [Sorangium sp. So ce315]|uniref:Mov34/MPN/PAD-1 family protein n=1 Tax=Sorangium sp. So ce315 TaxID=3133299 RepID=UPI003F5E6AD0
MTQNSQTSCSASISLGAGESVVGYYHTHPAGVDTEFSPEDIAAAEASNRMYFVACSDGCGYRYDPATNITSHQITSKPLALTVPVASNEAAESAPLGALQG